MPARRIYEDIEFAHAFEFEYMNYARNRQHLHQWLTTSDIADGAFQVVSLDEGKRIRLSFSEAVTAVGLALYASTFMDFT